MHEGQEKPQKPRRRTANLTPLECAMLIAFAVAVLALVHEFNGIGDCCVLPR